MNNPLLEELQKKCNVINKSITPYYFTVDIDHNSKYNEIEVIILRFHTDKKNEIVMVSSDKITHVSTMLSIKKVLKMVQNDAR